MKKHSTSKFFAETRVSSITIMEGQSTTTVEIDEEENECNIDPQVETTAFTISKMTLQNRKCNVDNEEILNNLSPEKSSTGTTNNGSASHQSHISDISRVDKEIATCPASVDKLIPSKREKKESLEAKRERKAAKTLAIITGAFVMCWLPFFILALVMPLCGESCAISDFIMSFALWLGYFNSTLNPVIYTIFNPEFRQAFKKMLCGGHGHVKNYRSGKVR